MARRYQWIFDALQEEIDRRQASPDARRERRVAALRNMTEARGCTPAEAETAGRLADQLDRLFGS